MMLDNMCDYICVLLWPDCNPAMFHADNFRPLAINSFCLVYRYATDTRQNLCILWHVLSFKQIIMQLRVDLNFASILYYIYIDLIWSPFSCDFPGQEVMALQAMRRSGVTLPMLSRKSQSKC